jgi:hypothetical protein
MWNAGGRLVRWLALVTLLALALSHGAQGVPAKQPAFALVFENQSHPRDTRTCARARAHTHAHALSHKPRPTRPPAKLASPPAPPSRTKWTRRVPHPVLIGHAMSLTPATDAHAADTTPEAEAAAAAAGAAAATREVPPY